MTLRPLMRLIVSMEKYNKNYQNLINKLPNQVNMSTLGVNNRKNYNTILKGINAIKNAIKKNNEAADRYRQALALRRKNRKATKIQAHVRGFLERKQQNKARFVPVTGPNGTMSIAVRTIPTSGFRAIAAKRAAEKRNLNRMLQGFAN
jgi:hypothetical protein